MKDQSDQPLKYKKGEYIAGIIFNLIFYFILSRLDDWSITWLNENYHIVVLIMKVNIIIQVAGFLILLLKPATILFYLVRIIMEAAGLVPLVMLYYLYPFNFEGYHNLGWLDKLLPFIFILAFIIGLIQVITLIIRLIFSIKKKCEDPTH